MGILIIIYTSYKHEYIFLYNMAILLIIMKMCLLIAFKKNLKISKTIKGTSVFIRIAGMCPLCNIGGGGGGGGGPP